MKTYPTLYKRTSTGAIQVWFMELDGSLYRTTSGQRDGKKTTTEWTQATSKNIGRANETTPEQQAELEIESAYTHKLERDYRHSPDEIDTLDRFKPMLATKWPDMKDKLALSSCPALFIQPKLDGIRCIVNKNGMWSREGKPILAAPHIFDILAPLFDRDPTLIFDGELYNHELKSDFNKIVSLVKKQKPTPEVLGESADTIQYWVYDLPSSKTTFGCRWQDALALIGDYHPKIIWVYTDTISYKDIDETAGKFIERGYEGAMIRVDRPYENKRSQFLVKWKEFQDEEFEIVDIQEGDGNSAGMAARVILRLKDGKTFKAGMIGNETYLKQLLLEKDNHIGELGTVVFQNYTPDGVPRFPKFKAVRFDVYNVRTNKENTGSF